MRNFWTLFAGIFFAAWVVMWTAPVWVGVTALIGWGGAAELFRAFSGESVFGVRDVDGRLQGRLINVGFQTALVPVAGDPRPRRLLLRLEVINSDVFNDQNGDGRVRLDAWPLDGALDMLQLPIYTVVAPGASAEIQDQSILQVTKGNRRSAYSLTDGRWIFDADSPPATFVVEGERRRMAALAVADDEFPAGSIAVATLASPQKSLHRVLLRAGDTARARLLRTSVGMTRPVLRLPDAHSRWVDISLPAGTIRLPVVGDQFDLARAELPVGLSLIELKPWGKQN